MVLILNRMSLSMRNILLCTGIAVLLSASANACAKLHDDRNHPLGLWGIGLACAALLASILAVWDVFASPKVFSAAIILINFAVALAHLAVLIPVRDEGPTHPLIVRIAASATMISTILCALLITGLFGGMGILPVNAYLQLILILMTLSIAGSAVTPILVHMRGHFGRTP